MGCREIAGALSLSVVSFGWTGSALAQASPPFVPEFKLLCHPSAHCEGRAARGSERRPVWRWTVVRQRRSKHLGWMAAPYIWQGR